MRKMWREGHRRSPRISALDAKKAHPSRSSTVTQSRCSNNSTTNISLHFKNHLKKRRRLGTGVGPASRTGGKKKRKLKPLQDVASLAKAPEDPRSSDEQDGKHASPEDLQINIDQRIVQDKDNQTCKDQITNLGQPPAVQCASWIPEKRILELILDVLQRRDTHEIFAEPVDQEVEDYYEIIKEPMDFGTMRAKLHEGMYNSLEQFEHDVFLISGNAMHFNSSSTIYFRQARAIDELAKKVFHVLKTDPQNFEFEFSGTRRRTSRRPKCETKSSAYSPSSKLFTNSRSNNGTANVSRTTVLSSASNALRTAMRLVPGCSGSSITTQSDLRDDEVPFGGGDGRGSSSSEANRRSTYLSVLNGNSIVSTVYSNSKLLMHMNQQENSYRESLMLFVKDLGPTAQMVAKRKLNGRSTEATNYLNSGTNWLMAPNCKNHMTSRFEHPGQWMPGTRERNSQNLINGYRMDSHDADKGEKAYSGSEKQGICGSTMEIVSHGNDRSVFGAIRQESQSSNDIKAGDVSRSHSIQQNQNSVIQIGSPSFITNGRNLNFSVAGLNNEKKSEQLKLEKSKMDDKLQLLDSPSKDSQQHAVEHRLSNNYSFSSPSWTLETMANGKSGFDQTIGCMNNLTSPFMRGYDQAVAAGPAASHELGSSTETEWRLKSSETLTPVSPQFIFDIPFLKTRLDQMNSFGQDRYLQQSSGGQGSFLRETYHDHHHPHSSLDAQLTNLALQL